VSVGKAADNNGALGEKLFIINKFYYHSQAAVRSALKTVNVRFERERAVCPGFGFARQSLPADCKKKLAQVLIPPQTCLMAINPVHSKGFVQRLPV
jgi:hypothetical protein